MRNKKENWKEKERQQGKVKQEEKTVQREERAVVFVAFNTVMRHKVGESQTPI